ncbi:MAG: DMT family transporter [Anderseniella sp.]
MSNAGKSWTALSHSNLLIWAAIPIFAAGNSIVRLLFDLGSQHAIDGRNAISFCNVLFVGNLCAMLTLLVVYRKSWTREQLTALSVSQWASLTVLAVLLGALAPSLVFLALEKADVTNVVLFGRIEPPLYMLLAYAFLRERSSRWAAAAAIVTTSGVVLILFLQQKGGLPMIGEGELLALAGAGVYAGSSVLSKRILTDVPLGIFMVFRTGLGAIIFFVIASYLYGINHFQDAFSPFLWQWMLVYGGIVVVLGQVLWFAGLRGATPSNVSLASSFTPIAGVLFAIVLLGEQPSAAVLTGGAVMMLGIAVGVYGILRSSWTLSKMAVDDQEALTLEGHANFKGI